MYQPIYEQKALPAPRQQVYNIGNLESIGASALYSGDNPKISRDGKAFFVPLKVNGVSFHDTYRVDSEGNLSEGHSTVNLKGGGKVYMPHGDGKPSIKKGS